MEATPERDEILQFIKDSQRGIMKGYYKNLIYGFNIRHKEGLCIKFNNDIFKIMIFYMLNRVKGSFLLEQNLKV